MGRKSYDGAWGNLTRKNQSEKVECDRENPARKKRCDNVESKEMPELLRRFNLERGESFMGVRSEQLFSELY